MPRFAFLSASWLVLAVWSPTLIAAASAPSFTPKHVAVDTKPVLTSKAAPSSITLSSQSSNVATLDYGYEVAGYPYFVVSSLSKPAQIELKYSEEFNGLNAVFADGPYYFANGLSNTFRVETFNVTGPGRYQSTLIQGGQRWEAATLLTAGEVTFSEFGFQPSIDVVDLSDTPSSFSCSSNLYDKIWKLGARAVTAACVDAGSQKATWQVTRDGAYVVGQRPGTSAYATAFSNYKLIFESKIARTGTGWAYNYGSAQEGYVFVLTSNLPQSSTFANVNKTLTPPNTLVLSQGWGPVNQTSLESYHLDNFQVPFPVLENQWYTIQTALSTNNYLSVTINETLIFNVSTYRYSWAPSPGFFGGSSFGFGGYQDTAAYFRNVTVINATGSQIYHNNLTDAATVLPEYGVDTNTASVCMDGAKRDRLVWLGDFFHTSRIIPASTARWDYVTGTLAYLAAWQNPIGLLSIDPPIGYSPSFKGYIGSSSYFGLEDYQLLGLSALYNYYERTGDLISTAQLWPAYKTLATFLLSTIDPTSHLINIGGFLGPAYGTATSALFVQAMHGASVIATALNDTVSASLYTNATDTVTTAINTHLWNPALGMYALSNSSMSDFSIAGLGFAITSGVANASRAATAIAALGNLTLYPGYKDNTQAVNAGANISPNTNGFLLEGLLAANATAPAKYLLDTLWGAAMVQQPKYASGASWEYVGQDLTPGLSLFTSLSHPWGGAPTYVMTDYIAGVRPVTPGYKVFVVAPGYQGFGLTHAKAKVKTEYGTLSVKWTLKGSTLSVTVNAPVGTSGTIQLPGGKAMGKVAVNGVQSTAAVGTAVEVGSGVTTVDVQV